MDQNQKSCGINERGRRVGFKHEGKRRRDKMKFFIIDQCFDTHYEMKSKTRSINCN